MTDEPQPRRTPDGTWVPTPDPTILTTEAVSRATDVFRRELHSLRETLETRMVGSDEDRTRIWARLHDLPELYETFTAHLRSELIERDAHSREVIDQRIIDLDASVDRRFSLTADLPERIKADRRAELKQLQKLMESRFGAMDRASELLAADLRMVPSTLEERLHGLRELTSGRLDSIDKATDLRLRETEKLPAATREQIDQLRKLHEEKFASIAQQFAERDIRTSEAAKSAKDALDAALQAAKELVNAQGEASSAAAVKSETSFTKQIDQIGTIISTLEKALDARITELKERIDRGEGSQTGTAAATVDSHYGQSFEQNARLATAANLRTQVATVISGLAVVISIIAIVVLIFHKLPLLSAPISGKLLTIEMARR